VLKHVDQPAVHRAIALCKEVCIDWFIPKVEVPSVAIIENAVALQPITKPLELSSPSLALAFTLVAGLLVDQKVLCKHPRLLPYVS
jgi:hypothetical protein